MKKKYRLGFTLLELLVVISIIGILLGAGSVSYSTTQKKARDAKRKLDVESIKTAMEQYYLLCNTYPAPDENGKPPPSIIAALDSGCSTDSTIMEETPVDPKSLVGYDFDISVEPYKICTSNNAGGSANLLETETDPFCVKLNQ